MGIDRIISKLRDFQAYLDELVVSGKKPGDLRGNIPSQLEALTCGLLRIGLVSPHEIVDVLGSNFSDPLRLGLSVAISSVLKEVHEFHTQHHAEIKGRVAIAGGTGLIKDLAVAKLQLAGYKADVVFTNRFVEPGDFDRAIEKGADYLYVHDQSIEACEGQSCIPALLQHLHADGRFSRFEVGAILVNGKPGDDAASLGVDAIVTDPLKIVETIESLPAASAA